MNKVKVSTVRYANSYPMNWGLKKGAAGSLIDIEFDHPSGVAAKLSAGRADIGLVPVAAIPTLKNPKIVGSWCIGTNGRVRTVMLMSNSPIEEIETIWLDHRSVTSVNLARVLAREYWQKEFRWESPGETFDYATINKSEGIVIIGDQCFGMENRFTYSYDLGEAWYSLTGLPFVFACWVAVNSPDRKFITIFDESIAVGIENREIAIAEMNTLDTVTNEELATYLNENIDYRFDSQKRDAMNLFLGKIKTINKR
jgi:chorismate dehydratase